MERPGEQSPVRSMTGFARITAALAEVDLEAEIRSVNHRFFELSIRSPRAYSSLERDLRGVLQGHHKRGRFDLVLSRRIKTISSHATWIESESFSEAVAAYAAACKRYGVGVGDLSSFIGELVIRDAALSREGSEVSEQELAAMRELVARCSELVREDRQVEGRALVSDIEARIALIELKRQAIVERVTGSSARMRARLSERLAALAPEVRLDPERLALEVAILADRVDVSEELSRLAIHLTQFDKLLHQGGSDGVGRKLDFMVQEIGRELNTTGTKAQDAEVQGIVVEAKAELERIREQVQNIE
jgi:uncharacterized protein (TIGR00255 family)